MTPWSWWAGVPGEECYDLAADCPTREAAISEALRSLGAGEQFQVVEARASEAAKYEGSDFVPFLRTRHHEVLTAGPQLLPA